MNVASRGWIGLLVLAGLLVGVLSIAVVGGFVGAEERPNGTEILTDVEEQYEDANSTVVDATVATEHEDQAETFAVHLVTTRSGQMRVNVSNESEHLVAGTNGNVTWIAGTQMESPLVMKADGVENSTYFAGGNWTALSGTSSNFSLGNESNLTHMQGLETISTESFAAQLNESGLTSERYGVLLSEHNTTHASNGTPLAQFDRANWSISRTVEETNLTAERVETVPGDGQDLHIVIISAPAQEEQLKLWVSADDATVVKEQLTTPNGTVTVEMETRFNVSPTESTFQPPSAIVSDDTIYSIADLRTKSTGQLAVPGENWTFTQGNVLNRPVSLTAAQYTNEQINVTVLQTDTAAVTEFASENRTMTVSNRTVTVTDLSSVQTDMTWLGLEEGVVGQWTENDQTIMVTGNLSDPLLREVIESIEIERSDS